MNLDQLDKSAFEVSDLNQDISDRKYWLSRTPVERIQAVEYLRIVNYGEAALTSRLQRIFEVAERL